MNVLLTGGAGYLGPVVADHLLSQGHRVRVLDNLLYGGTSLLGLYHRDGFEFVHGDIRSSGAVSSAVRGVDAVVHLAAIVGDPACARQPEVARAVNLDAALEVFESARRHGLQQFVFASTCSNYGKMPDPAQLATEDSDLRPVSLYAETKVGVEQTLLRVRRDGDPGVTVLRLATLYGVAPRMRFDLTVNEFTMELVTNRRLEVYGEQFWRPYVHVRDAARAIGLALAHSPGPGGYRVYNVGNTRENYQKKQLVELIRAQVTGDLAITYVARKEDPRDYRVAFERIARELPFATTRTVPDGIREVIAAIQHGVITDLDNPFYRN